MNINIEHQERLILNPKKDHDLLVNKLRNKRSIIKTALAAFIVLAVVGVIFFNVFSGNAKIESQTSNNSAAERLNGFFNLEKLNGISDHSLEQNWKESINLNANFESKSFFEFIDITGGYMDMKNDFEDQIWYTYTKNFNGNADAPLIVAHPGGPGLISQVLLTNGGGPMEVTDDYTLKKATGSYVEFADLLIADLPDGTGLSKTNMEKFPKDITVDDFMKVSIDFFEKLNAKRPELRIKERNIIFYGMSYGTGFWLYMAKALKERGYKIGGMFLDSGYVSARAGFQTFVETMTDHKILGKGTLYDPTGAKQIKYTKDCNDCADKCIKYRSSGQLPRDEAAKCLNVFEGNEIYQIGGKPTQASIYDQRNDANLNIWAKIALGTGSPNFTWWSTNLVNMAFNNPTSFEVMNAKVSDYAYKYNLAYEYLDQFQWAFDNDVNIHFINGGFDGICAIAETQKWMSEVKGLDMESKQWQKTMFGKIKRLTSNFTYEIYDNSGHCVGIYHPDYAVDILKNLVDRIGKKLNE